MVFTVESTHRVVFTWTTPGALQAVIKIYNNNNEQRVVGRGPWNLLPANIVESPTVNAFKNPYDSIKTEEWAP